MERPSYLSKYLFDWDLLAVMLGGRSFLDAKYFVGTIGSKEEILQVVKGYGLDFDDPISNGETFGTFQEALQFIKRYFLKEGNPEGLDLKMPNSLYMITDISELFFMVSTKFPNKEERLWAEIVLKVMHTILHVDKDLRSNYFTEIQTQIFDRFYRYLYRDEENKLFLGDRAGDGIPLVNFETKSKKPRDSVIIKLLHKAEHVAEELFDRVGVRFITENKFDTLRVMKFLIEKSVVIPHSIKPSRSINTLIDLDKFKLKYRQLIRMCLKNNLSEERFVLALNREANECRVQLSQEERNRHTAKNYHSIQFTCRQLIKYSNPFLHEFNMLRETAKQQKEKDELAQRILSMDISHIAKDVRFFYPYEVQVVDSEGHKINTIGEASHQEYKKAQIKSAMTRVFRPLIKYKNL